ncbi:MAG TPA: amino acid ABC transporter permease [Pararhizobium sp.]|nr:amino acid ABC transporter permease [Pararhizobium sp.]
MYNFDFAPVFARFGHLLDGAAVTMELSCGAMIIGLVISIICAAAKTSRIAPLRWAVSVYVEAIRNTPFLIQIFFIYFGLPAAGISFNPNPAALVALTVNVGAYGTEIIRAGIESIQRGQVEAGIALGLKPVQIFRYIILKPALRTVYPALTSQFIFLMLTSSVVSVISATDLAAAGNDINSETFASFETYIVVTAMYLVMSSILSAFFSTIQRMAFRYPLSR